MKIEKSSNFTSLSLRIIFRHHQGIIKLEPNDWRGWSQRKLLDVGLFCRRWVLKNWTFFGCTKMDGRSEIKAWGIKEKSQIGLSSRQDIFLLFPFIFRSSTLSILKINWVWKVMAWGWSDDVLFADKKERGFVLLLLLFRRQNELRNGVAEIIIFGAMSLKC